MSKDYQNQLENLLRLSRELGRPLYVVGGTLRDRFMGKACADFDFACNEAPEVSKRFAKAHSLTLVPLDSTPGRETHRVVIARDVYFDFTTLQGKTLEDDLAHRDFTINAMGQPLEDLIAGKDTLVDPFGGVEDIASRTVRALPGPVFEDDPLRLLRAYRFANTLGFDIDEETSRRIAETRGRIRTVAAERLSHELLILLGTPNSHLDRLVETGLLSALIPELALHFDDGPADSLTDNGAEALRILDRLEILLVETEKISPKHRTRFREYIDVPPRRALLKLAVLLRPLEDAPDQHLTGTRIRNDSLPVRIMKDLRLSNDHILFTDRALAVHHNVLEYATNMPATNEEDDLSGIYQLCKQAEDDFFSGAILATAVKMEVGDDLQPFLLALNRLVEFYLNTYRPAQANPTLLNGRTLTRKFQLSPSPAYKTILDRVEEARVLGRIATRRQAEALAADLIQQLKLKRET
ncbi:putative CCA tRNA nucleotidyltransferase (modular protein) [Nitrospina gracilis 3/211]|uniref:Putative CCA tRNA nucleotidyltransferase (Modular protein) n=1 Tax=Nitrospina gracilis (strain 3/211) TaxID=1266370 RepID=M1YLD9_NITG3|nr:MULTISPECIES: CCA tRNA nucleotidyltransferase [Nitrospina]MCF8724150.1 tRNA nucleotidyltransferase/poly(A) polymerase [Nitrospina sp. Nb-3]CCQ91296.1 putative CCA tRNA nucleotidyltransferase (modular protein) [Nitrospina gracilis 3/211]